MAPRRDKLLLGLAAVALALVSPYLFWHPRRLNPDGFEKIQVGMSQAEVEDCLGGPPGRYYPTYAGAGQGMTDEGYLAPGATIEMLWYDDRNRYEIWFDDLGRVAGKHKRSMWYSDGYTSRHTAMIWGRRDPIPLEPKKYTTAPIDVWRGNPPPDNTKP